MIAALALLAIPQLSPGLEFELAGGVADSLQPGGGSTYQYPFATPVVQGRAATTLPLAWHWAERSWR
jgi:hypothetical protein